MTRFLPALFVLLASPVLGQDDGVLPPIENPIFVVPDVAAESIKALAGKGASLKALDKMSGQASDLTLVSGETQAFGHIEISLGECRYPEDTPTGEAYAWLTIRDPRLGSILFDGWMIASSPAINALDNARYDVWVIRCTTA
jgi:hypothetical protein